MEQEYGKPKDEGNMSKTFKLCRYIILIIQLRWHRGIVFTCIRVSSHKYLPKLYFSCGTPSGLVWGVGAVIGSEAICPAKSQFVILQTVFNDSCITFYSNVMIRFLASLLMS